MLPQGGSPCEAADEQVTDDRSPARFGACRGGARSRRWPGERRIASGGARSIRSGGSQKRRWQPQLPSPRLHAASHNRQGKSATITRRNHCCAEDSQSCAKNCRVLLQRTRYTKSVHSIIVSARASSAGGSSGLQDCCHRRSPLSTMLSPFGLQTEKKAETPKFRGQPS